ncbi:MAG: hypothetical protein AUK55_04830 [Syntrophobacteraceae bacterium CG2_30_61_12]|nr:MAG: hypothetical protein AUK55_04830 [Syntrophobacteraceae bacterium CG2_30_61_12]
MSVKVDPNLMKDLKAFGLKDANKCFHCGNCTATCPLSTPGNEFPRKFMKYAQMGLKEKIVSSPEPWLCYYCGNCSVECPRGADPGETMMVMRRYLTSIYDWTGFSRKFYTSEKFEIMALVIVGLLVGLGMLVFHGEWDMQRVSLQKAWPAEKMEIADMVMASILTFFLLSNVFRSAKIMMGDLLTKIPLKLYASELKELLLNFLTQKRFGQCDDRTQWFVHLMLMTGYSTAFLLVAVFLAGGIHVVGLSWEPLRFQRDVFYPFFHPIRLLGYYATFAIFYGATYAMIGRLKKSKPAYQNSHSTDWVFLILLQLTTLTGILVHFGRHLNMPFATYSIYIIHLMIAVPMLVLEVPFAKWAHLAYRPVALFLVRVKAKYEQQQAE